MTGAIQDARYGLRLLRREPGFSLLAILTIALGIGATTTLFSITYGVLMKPLPWPEAERVVRVTEARKGRTARIRGTVTNGAYLAWREHASTIDALGGYGIVANNMTVASEGSEPARIQVGRLTASMFDVLRVRPVRGRAFTADETPMGSPGPNPTPQVVLLSYGLWRDWFGGRDDAIGRQVRFDEAPVTIVGVMPRDFAFPDRETRAWLPMPIGAVLGEQGIRRLMIFGALARLKPGVALEQAATEATVRARTAPDPGMAAVSMFGSTAPPDISLTRAADAMTGEVKPALVLLLTAVLLLLATAVANVGGLQLARASTRRRELAVRAAVGAGGRRLVRQLVVENAIIGLSGGAIGLVVTAALHRALPWLLPADFPRLDDISVNLPVLLFAAAASIAASVACGLLPAIPATRVSLVDVLAADGGGSVGGIWRSRSGRLRTIVMGGQLAVAALLLIVSVLLGRSFVALLTADRGYDPSNVLTATVDLPERYDGLRKVQFADAVLARLRGTPGLTNVAAANALPFLSLGNGVGFEMPSPTDPAVKVQVQASLRSVSPDYFPALRLQLVAGRLIADSDSAPTTPVVVVNRSFARRYLGTAPLGMKVPLRFERDRSQVEVVGVVDDMHQASVADPPVPELFVSYRQVPTWMVRSSLIFVARTSDDPLAHVAPLRTAVREQDPSVVLDDVMTMDERLLTSLAKPRLYALVLGGFGSFAVIIAGLGLFGVLSYSVAQRTREIGVRTALGARPMDVVALVLRQALLITSIGVGIGLWLAYASGRLVARFLYGVGPHDPATFAIVAAVLLAVGVVASMLPARRAARIDPLTALRS